MMAFLSTTTGKLAALVVFYLPFFSALFFSAFDGKTFESPIGGCCMSMEGLVGAAYVLFTIWIVAPLLTFSLIYRLYRRTAR